MNNQLLKKNSITIVGQGLAGSLLAWSLIEQGFDVCIYSDGKTSASHIAAGLINPVTGQRFVLADNTPEMLQHAAAYYRNIEEKLNIHCYHPMPMMRLFSSEKEQRNCEKRLKNKIYDEFLHQTDLPLELQDTYSGIQQTNTAWLDTNTLLNALNHYFLKNNMLKFEAFQTATNKQTVIYCEGYQMINNPLFSWLPLQPSHGEIITCTSQQALPDYIINQGKWLLPISKYQCRVGATYDTHISAPTLQDASKKELLDFATHTFKENKHLHVIQHQAGIRPNTLDKKPFIGFHPKHKHAAIFNGFGSRGSLIIPWYAHHFSQNHTPDEANIHRYKTLCV